MSGNGGRRRQVRQRTSKDAAYAKRLQDVGGAAGASTTSSRHDGEPSAAAAAAAAAAPAAAVSTPSGGGGRKRPRSAADSEASASRPIAAAADADGTSRRARRRGPGPGWSCAACTLHNPSRKRKCEVCGAAKPAAVSSDEALPGAMQAEKEQPSTKEDNEQHAVSDNGGGRDCDDDGEDNAGDTDGKPEADATGTATMGSSSSGRSRARSRSSSGNAVSEWLRKRKRGKQQGGSTRSSGRSSGGASGKGSSKKGSRSRSKSSGCRGGGDSNGRSRSKSPIPLSSSTAAGEGGSPGYLEGVNPRDIKVVRVRVFDRFGGQDNGSMKKGNHPSQRIELSDSGPLMAKVLVGWPKFCATKEGNTEEDAATEETLRTGSGCEETVPTATVAAAAADGAPIEDDSDQKVSSNASSSELLVAPVGQGDNDDVVADRKEEENEMRVEEASLEVPAVPIDHDSETPCTSGSQAVEGAVADELSPSYGYASKCEGKEAGAALKVNFDTTRDETIAGSSSTAEPASPQNDEELSMAKSEDERTAPDSRGSVHIDMQGATSNEVVESEGKRANVFDDPHIHVRDPSADNSLEMKVVREPFPATRANEPSAPTDSPVNSNDDAALMNMPSRPTTNVAATDETELSKECRANTLEEDCDRYQSFSYGCTGKMEASVKEVQASPHEFAAGTLEHPAAPVETAGGIEPREDKVGSDEKAVDPGSATVAETSHLEANDGASASETIAEADGEAQLEIQRDLSVPSQNSNDDYDAFQPLTQAVPVFEYGYDLTQQHQDDEDFQQKSTLSYSDERENVHVDAAAGTGASTRSGQEVAAVYQAMPVADAKKPLEIMPSVEVAPAPEFAEDCLDDTVHKAAERSAVPLFSTGGGSSISISAEALAKADQMFQAEACGGDVASVSGPLPHSNQEPADSQRTVVLDPSSLFSTAGGSSISISAEAMKRAGDVFSDSVPEISTNEVARETDRKGSASAHNLLANKAPSRTALQSSPLDPSSTPAKVNLSMESASKSPGVTTIDYELGLATQSPSIAKASAPILSTVGKKRDIAVDPQAVAHDKLLVEDRRSKQVQGAPSSAMPALFSTAGKGLAIEVSTEGLDEANRIFEGSNNNGASMPMPLPALPPSATASLFSTAGGSSISVTADAVARASEILADAPQKASSSTAPSAAALFCTAGGSSIAVSDDALAKAGQLFGDADKNQSSPPITSTAPPASAPSATMALFSTAGGASISVSDVAMSKANQIFADKEAEAVQTKCSSSSIPAPAAASILGVGGLFSTAGGSSIAVSYDAISKANQILAEPIKEATSSSLSTSAATLFSTAGGASIAVSDDAVAKANQMMNEAAKASSSTISSKPASNAAASVLFATAGGSSITVSDDAMAKASQMFGKKTSEDTDSHKPTSSSAFASMPPPMFATAGQGTSIAVSDDALMKANEVFAQKNSSLDPLSGNQGEAKGSRGSERPRIHFAETPAQPAVWRRTNRSSLGGTEAKIINIAQHMHPAETPLPVTSSREGSTHPLSTKKVLFREDTFNNHHQDSSHRLGAMGLSSGAHSSGKFAKTASTAVGHTPKQTPQVARKPAAAVTRSTIVKNPYAKRPGAGTDSSSTSSYSSAVTPVPFAFKHVEGTFSGKKFSPKTLERAARIFDQPSSQSSAAASSTRRSTGYGGGATSASTTPRRPRRLNMDGANKMRLDGSDFRFSIDGYRLTLQEFDDIYGPMEEASPRACLDNGANSVLLKIKSANASKLRFDEQSGLPCAIFGAGNAPTCKLVGSVQDLRRDLISNGCDEALLVDNWIVNHFGWINWKLACTERRYPHALAGKYITYDHVLAQLKGRYDREVANAKRPALRIILNRDASAGRLMILCVAQIHHFRIKIGSADNEESNSPRPSTSKSFREELRLELTDGWYSVQAVLDSHLQSFVEKEKIKIGTKLLVAGAELAGSEDGIDPLDVSYQPSRSSCPVALKLVANATRRAKWDARLGFVRQTRQIQSQDGLLLVKSMGDVIPGGGSAPLMDLIICRRFPRLFLEKGPDGTSTILTEAQEERRRREFDERRHREMEKISEAAEKQCTREIDEQAPEQWRKMTASNAMCDYYERLSRDDKAAVDRWEERRSTLIGDMTRRMIDAKMQSNVSLIRSSTPFLRLTVKTLQNLPSTSATVEDDDECILPNHPSATLTVWRMTEDQSTALKEGTVVRIKDLAVKSELRGEMLQFSANDKTRMQALAQQPSSRQLQYSGFSKRSFAPVVRAHVLSRKASVSRKASGVHIDFAGVLVRSDFEQQGTAHQTSHSYFTDESGLLLRLHRDIDPNDESTLAGWNKVLELGQVLAFRDVLVLPFDSKANCAVVSWSQPTLQEKNGQHSNDKRIRTLQKWTETDDAERICAKVLASFDAGLPLYCRLPHRTEIAMGYILAIRFRGAGAGINEYGGQYRSGATADHSFEIDVDCGGGSNVIVATCSRAVLSQTIEMHLDPASHNGAALDLKDLLRQSGGALAPCDMNNLNLLFTESGVLFQVMLRRQSASLEILQITPADIEALAALYLEAVK